MRRSAFLTRIVAANKARQAAAQDRAIDRQQGLVARREKLLHDAWKVRESAWDTLYAVAQVLGGQAIVNRGGNALELQGVPTPVRFDIAPGAHGIAITALWGKHEVERTFPSIAAAGRFVEECVEAAVKGSGPAPRKKPTRA